MRMPISGGMKNQLVLVSTGLGACLLLTMMMGHLLSMNPARRYEGPVADAFSREFSGRLSKAPMLVLKGESVEHPDRFVVLAKIRPKDRQRVGDLVDQVGAWLWKQDFGKKKISEVVVRWRLPGSRRSDEASIAKPGTRRVLRLYR